MRSRMGMLVGSWLVAAGLACGGEPPLQEVARDLVGADQGVFVQAEDGTVLASIVADRPVHPASVTKVASSLALLERLGPRYRFETRLFATGPVRDGALLGDLRVEAGTDPFLIYENAQVMLLELRAQGIRVIDDALRVQGVLLFNWKPDPDGQALKRALEGKEGADAWAAVRAVHTDAPPAPRQIGLRFAGRDIVRERFVPQLLVVHRSPPLVRVVKALNCYSNNVFHQVSDRIGGPEVVEREAREAVAPALRDQIIIDNGAGAGTTNRMSPRAAVAVLDALDRELARHDLALTDALPVSGIDQGTLRRRLGPGLVVGKTGTFGSVGASALAGMLRTRKHGKVTFAILNYWLPVPEAHKRQDAFVRALAAATDATPWPYDGRALPRFTEASVETGS